MSIVKIFGNAYFTIDLIGFLFLFNI